MRQNLSNFWSLYFLGDWQCSSLVECTVGCGGGPKFSPWHQKKAMRIDVLMSKAVPPQKLNTSLPQHAHRLGWLTLAIQALWRLRQEDCVELGASLSYKVISCVKNKQTCQKIIINVENSQFSSPVLSKHPILLTGFPFVLK